MKTLLAAMALLGAGLTSHAQTHVTVDANDVVNSNNKLIIRTSQGQSFFTGWQGGSGYSFGQGIFRAITENPNGAGNFYYDGVTNGVTNFSVRADGQGYFGGNLGIGTNTPIAKLQVNGTMLFSGGGANLDPRDVNGNIGFLANSGQMLIGWNLSGSEGETDFITNQGPGVNGGYAFYNYDNASNTTQLIRIKGTGQVVIGPDNFPLNKLGNNRLAVSGGILAEQVNVKLQGSWPDGVFKRGYHLRPLSDVKAYVASHHHLPDVPSETEVSKSGQNLGEMNKILLKKVEELTLYMLEKDRQIKHLSTRIQKLEHRQHVGARKSLSGAYNK